MKAKDHNKNSKFFDEPDAVLGHRPASAPSFVLDVSAGGISVERSEERNDDRGNGRIILVFLRPFHCWIRASK